MCVWWGWRIKMDYGIMFKICFFWRLLFHHSEVTFLGKAQCRIFARISSEMMDLAEELLPASFSACYNLPRCLVVETLFLLFPSFCSSFLSFYPGLLPASSWDSEIMTPRSLIYAFFFFKVKACFLLEALVMEAAVTFPLMIMPQGTPQPCWALHVKLTLLIGGCHWKPSASCLWQVHPMPGRQS